MKRLVFICFVLTLSFVSKVHAEEGQPYYGGFEVFATSSELVAEKDLVGVTSRFVEDDVLLGTLESSRRLSYNDAGHGKRIYMGVSSAANWDWEWGYIDFGKSSGRYEGPTSSVNVDLTTDAKAEGWFLHVQFSPRISERFEANLKLGVLRWDGSRYSRLVQTDQSTGASTGKPLETFETTSGIDEYFGAGLIFTINERWKIRADANRYMLADDQMDTYSIAAQFWFTGRLINNIFDY